MNDIKKLLIAAVCVVLVVAIAAGVSIGVMASTMNGLKDRVSTLEAADEAQAAQNAAMKADIEKALAGGEDLVTAEEFENKLADALGKNTETMQSMIATAVANQIEDLDVAGLTEEQVNDIIAVAVENCLTEDEINEIIAGSDTGLSKSEVKKLINEATYGYLTYAQISALVEDGDYALKKKLEKQIKALADELGVKLEEIEGNLGNLDSDMGDSELEENTNTAEKTVVIENARQLASLATSVNSGNTYKGYTITLDADLDLAGIEWTPIGTSSNAFQGTFDGQDHTISNLSINTPSTNYVGLFGYTTDGEIKNLTIENATVSGRLGVGAVSGSPYTAKFTNITVTGLVQIEGMAYVGGVVGRNAYANLTDITIDVEEGSYVKADSVEDGVAYRTYVGGVVGFMGEGNITVKNVTSNIDVIGSTIDVGGIAGIAHYNNKFINCVCTGDVTLTGADEEASALEIGGIAGVWHNENGTSVTFDGCEFTGTLSSTYDGNDVTEFENGGLVGAAYSASGTGMLWIDGETTYSYGGVDYNYADYGETVTISGANGTTYRYILEEDATIKSVVVEEGIEVIGNRTFRRCYGLETVVLPESLTEIGPSVFQSCNKLESVNIPAGVTVIGEGAFAECTVLSSVVIPDGVTRLEKDVLRATGLKEITLHEDITYIGQYAFRDCESLTTIVILCEDADAFTMEANAVLNAATPYPSTTIYVVNDAMKTKIEGILGNGYAHVSVEVINETADVDEINDTLQNGGYVSLEDDVQSSPEVTAPYGNKTGYVQNGGVLNGNGNALDMTCYGDDYGVMTSGGMIQNITINACRAIMIMSPTQDIILDNVICAGDEVLYPINTGEYATVGGVDLIATNCTFKGWSSFAGIESASFTKCTFGMGSYYGGIDVDRVVKPYINTTFTDCKFEDNIYIDLSALGADCQIVIDNCTGLNGEVITAENWDDLLDTIELPTGRTLADCIIFK